MRTAAQHPLYQQFLSKAKTNDPVRIPENTSILDVLDRVELGGQN